MAATLSAIYWHAPCVEFTSVASSRSFDRLIRRAIRDNSAEGYVGTDKSSALDEPRFPAQYSKHEEPALKFGSINTLRRRVRARLNALGFRALISPERQGTVPIRDTDVAARRAISCHRERAYLEAPEHAQAESTSSNGENEI
jgi:hypothetical protein